MIEWCWVLLIVIYAVGAALTAVSYILYQESAAALGWGYHAGLVDTLFVSALWPFLLPCRLIANKE